MPPLTPEEILAMKFEVAITPAQANGIVEKFQSVPKPQMDEMAQKVFEIVDAHRNVDDTFKVLTQVASVFVSYGKLAIV